MEPSQPVPTAPTPTLRDGELLGGRFRIERFIAAGGMGEIYQAFDHELGERLALKTIRPEIADDERSMRRFRREIRLARRVTHPNVCRTFDLVPRATTTDAEQAPVTFVTMELLAGETLGDRLLRVGRMPLEQVEPIVRQVVAALVAAHAAGVVHRDLKSTNILLVPTADGERVVVTDFGLARLAPGAQTISSGSRPLTETVGIAGTPAYMTPEQLEGGTITAATDVYSLGVLIYEMLTGTLPFHGDTFLAMAVARLRQDPLPPRAYLPELDPHWDAAILRCLAREPKARFVGPLELLDFLDRGPAPPQSPVTPPAPEPRSGLWLALSTALLAAVLGLALYLSLRPAPGPTAEPPQAVAARGRIRLAPLRPLAPPPATTALGAPLAAELERALVAAGFEIVHAPDVAPRLAGTYFAAETAETPRVRLDLRLYAPSGELLAAIHATGEASDLARLCTRATEQLVAAGAPAPGNR